MARHNSEVRQLLAMVHDFLEGRLSFWNFHHAFIAAFVRLPEGSTGRQDAFWNSIYTLVLQSVPEREEALKSSLAELVHDPAG